MIDSSLLMESKMACSIDGISGSHLAGEKSLRIANCASDCSSPSCDLRNSLSELYYYEPHSYFSGLSTENGKLETVMLNEKPGNNVDEKMGFESCMEHKENHLEAVNGVCVCMSSHGENFNGSGILSTDTTVSEGLTLDFRERDLADIAGSPEPLNPLSDLSGDYDNYIRSLLYGQCCHGYALPVPILPNPPTFPSQFQNQKPLDTIPRSMPLNRNGFSQMNPNGVVLVPRQNPKNNPTQSNSALLEEIHKPQGTGTYFAKSNGCSCMERSSRGRGRNQAPGNYRQFQRHTLNNVSALVLPDKKSFKEGNHELPHAESPVLRHGKSELSHQSSHSALNDSHVGCFSVSPQKPEFGSLRYLSDESSQLASDACRGWGSTPSLVALEVKSLKPVPGSNQERVAKQAYHLRNEDDFPPLKNGIALARNV